MATSTEELPPWITYLEWDILQAQDSDGARVYEVNIKVRPGGLLAVLKARRGTEYLVAFVGAGRLSTLARKVAAEFREGGPAWRPDKYSGT